MIDTRVKLFLICILGLLVMHLAQEAEIEKLRKFKGEATEEIFEIYQKVHKKNYDQKIDEKKKKFETFKVNVKKINEVNTQNLPYKYGINEFTDMTPKEFAEAYLISPEQKKKLLDETVRSLQEAGIPEEEENTLRFLQTAAYTPLDWRANLLAPRNQGACGSCWAFATAGVVEGAVFNKYSTKNYLSVQELVDCDKSNYGCNGGLFQGAISYSLNRGLCLDSVYPYSARKRICKVPSSAKKFKIASFTYCSNYSKKKCTEDITYNNLAIGPTAVGIDGSVLQYYRSGIFTGTCTTDNHAVVAVGYATENGIDYWIVRNSWGAAWGESGHARIARNAANKNSCYVANESWGVTAA